MPNNILLTGATGYIGQQLLRRLLKAGHHVTCCVRRPEYFRVPDKYAAQVTVVKIDFLDENPVAELPGPIDAAYYLIHSMTASIHDFESMEMQSARNFTRFLSGSGCKQILYLSGISNEEELSEHLHSRFKVEECLRESTIPVTVLRAGIIVGAGSASFELIRDLVEKLPFMIAPKWLHTRSQPISIENVLDFLTKIVLQPDYFGQSFDIGGPEIRTYKEMLLEYAEVRGLRRTIITLPLMTPRLSSYWLYFVTSVSYPLAVNLVDSMKVEIICRPNTLAEDLGIRLMTYKNAVREALRGPGDEPAGASWHDALSSSFPEGQLAGYQAVPEYGVLRDRREIKLSNQDAVLDNIWSIGGQRGWYYGNWMWKIRGFIDKLFGGVGLRRGRTHPRHLKPGDAVDFWRVLAADRRQQRLLLYAEMKLPGEAWLEFKLTGDDAQGYTLTQTATFRPKGLWGRIYWYAVLPLHSLLFPGMLRKLVAFRAEVAAEAAAV